MDKWMFCFVFLKHFCLYWTVCIREHIRNMEIDQILMTPLVLTQISGPPFSPQPPGPGGIPGVCTSGFIQGGTSDAGPQRGPGPSLQQLRDRVDHQGARWHTPLWTAHPCRVKSEWRRRHLGGSGECLWGSLRTFNKLTTKSNPCLERETPLDSSWSYCGLLTIQQFFFILLAVCSWTFLQAGGLRRFQRRTNTACTLCFGHSWAIFNFSSTRHILSFTDCSFLFFVPQFSSHSSQHLILFQQLLFITYLALILRVTASALVSV